MKQPASEQTRWKNDKKWTLVLLLLLFFMLSNLFLLWRLGQLAERNMGQIIDTIVLSPKQAEELPLQLCGNVQYSDGTPVVGHQVELHSTVRCAVTDEDGNFGFDNVAYGDHHLILLQQDGGEKILASLKIERNAALTDGKQIFTQKDDGTWYFQVPAETLLLEFEMEVNEAGDTLTVLAETVSALMADSRVMTQYGVVQASREGAVLTPHGSVMLADGTIHLHAGEVILPNGIRIDREGNVYKNGAPVSNSDLPDQYVLNTDNGIVYTPDGTQLKLEEMETHFADGTVVDNQGAITKPDGTVIDTRSGTITTPDGYQIDVNGTITDPNGDIYEGNTLPNGMTVGEDGTLSTPDGAVIALPKPGHGLTIQPAGEEKPAQPVEEEKPTQPVEEEKPTEPVEGETNPPGSSETENVRIIDKSTDKEWRQLTTIDLFKNGGLISPGASAEYAFYVRNGVSSPVRCRMTISEAAQDTGALPLEYRIKGKNGYVAGTEHQWLTAAELKEIWVTISAQGNVQYTLEWRWPYESGANASAVKANDRSDTSLGSAKNREHLIQVKIYAESMN